MKASRIKQKAQELGFELVGIARARPVPDFDFFRWWLDRGYAANMGYLQRGAEKRGDPSQILPGVQSLICCGLNYYTGDHAKDAPSPIARYAWGRDYHAEMGERLRRLENHIKTEIDPTARTRCYVDTGPVLERSYAARAGIGWIGKNTMLIHNGVGSFFFIGEILTTLDFEDDEYDRPALDQCGTCTRCLDACPTGALVEEGVLDSNKCISYLTIEHRGAFSPEQEKMVGGHVYGCDICQEVCPYNDRIPIAPNKEFQPGEIVKVPEAWEKISEEEFSRMTGASAMDRITYPMWKRNLEAVRKNRS